MRLKAVPPPPPSLDSLADITEAAPLVPEPRETFRSSLATRVEWISARESEAWLSLALALGLLREGESGIYRPGEAVAEGTVRERFVEGIYGVEEVLAALRADGPLTSTALADRVPIPPWERRRHADPEAVHRERIERLLGWLSLYGWVSYMSGSYHLRV